MTLDQNTTLPPFERPLSIHNNLYGDDILSMKLYLPELTAKCQRLRETMKGQNYSELRLPIFVLSSNKLEGTLSPDYSEGETFKVILNSLKQSSELNDDNQIHHIPWNEEGQNGSPFAWYSQCIAHVKAVQMMAELAHQGKPLDTETVLHCHNIMMNGAVAASGESFESRFRGWDEPVSAGKYVFPNKTNHEQDLAEKLEQINSTFETKHPVEWACDLLHAIVSLHPFLNGNGRLAHICFAYGMMRHGVPCAVVFSDWHSKARRHYIRGLQEAQGQKSSAGKHEKLHSMAVAGLFATLKNMVTFCESGSSSY